MQSCVTCYVFCSYVLRVMCYVVMCYVLCLMCYVLCSHVLRVMCYAVTCYVLCSHVLRVMCFAVMWRFATRRSQVTGKQWADGAVISTRRLSTFRPKVSQKCYTATNTSSKKTHSSTCRFGFRLGISTYCQFLFVVSLSFV